MAVRIKFDRQYHAIQPTFVLATKSGKKLGVLPAEHIKATDAMNTSFEASFQVHKKLNGKKCLLWDKIVDFKTMWCKEWDIWFEIHPEISEGNDTVKNITAIALGEAELSQINLYTVEINTETDISRDNYVISKLYDGSNPKGSILHRIMEKAPHYRIAHVDASIKDIQRTFSFDGISLYDAFQEISEEINCIFVINSGSNSDGKPAREISVYDLEAYCPKCGHRDNYFKECPKCGNTDVLTGYGEDTNIFVSTENLADEITYSTNKDSVKNCFRLEAGDDLMTATIANCNPNGSSYIWHISDDTKEDMSPELVEKLKDYDKDYATYQTEHISKIDTTQYNVLIQKYQKWNEDLAEIPSEITGYPALMTAYYNTIDFNLYLKSGMMPNVKIQETNASLEAAKLTSSVLSPVAVQKLASCSTSTASSAVLSMAKVIVDPRYQVKVKDGVFVETTWTGTFTVTNYSDETDTADSTEIAVTINEDKEQYIKQQIDRMLNKTSEDEAVDIVSLFNLEENGFKAELQKYCLSSLEAFRDSSQSCLDILIEQGVGDKETWADKDPDLYTELYLDYYNKSLAILDEIKLREEEIAIITGKYDADENLIVTGLQNLIETEQGNIQSALNFEHYLGTELWKEFISYRREDTYSNTNYISDGLNNDEIFDNALKFLEVARKEIYKSATLQHSITATLKNLLVMKEFAKIVKYFATGNWIRVKVDDKVFRLRLLSYTIDYDDLDNITIEFSDVTKCANGISDVESIIRQASSMITSYDAVMRQAEKGQNAKDSVDDILVNGLNAAHTRIKNNNTEDILIDKNGILIRSYDDITESYALEQGKITHNLFVYTTDGWNTVRTALGKHTYIKWENNQWVTAEDYGMTAIFVVAGHVTGSQIVGGEIVSQEYEPNLKGTYFNLKSGSFDIAGGRISYDAEKNKVILKDVTISWDSVNIPKSEEVNELINGLNFQETEISGQYIISPFIKGGYLDIANENNTARVIIDPSNLTENNYIFQVQNNGQTTVGIDMEGNARFSGDITGSTFTLDDNNGDGNFSINANGVIETRELSVSSHITTENIFCESISNPAYPKTLISNITLYVDAVNGTDDQSYEQASETFTPFKTLQGTIDSIPKSLGGKNVYIELLTDVTENIKIYYYEAGMMHIYLNGFTVYGCIRCKGQCNIRIYGGSQSGNGTDKTGIIHPSIGTRVSEYTNSVVFECGCIGHLQNIKVYGADNLVDETTKITAVGVQQGGFAYISDVVITNAEIGFRANAGGRLYSSSSNGVASGYGFLATTGGDIMLYNGIQAGGVRNNTSENHGGTVKYHTPTFDSGDATSDSATASTTVVNKTITYTSIKGNSIQNYGNSSAKWRSDNTPKVGNYGYGNHIAYWFFGSAFKDVKNKTVEKIQITFTRNSGGYYEAIPHDFYIHDYESQPNDVTPEYGVQIANNVYVTVGNSATIEITDSALISKIITAKGICSIPSAQDKAHYSVMSSGMKIKFYYQDVQYDE